MVVVHVWIDKKLIKQMLTNLIKADSKMQLLFFIFIKRAKVKSKTLIMYRHVLCYLSKTDLLLLNQLAF